MPYDSILATLTALHLAHQEAAHSYGVQRIEGLTAYVVAVGLLTGFAVTQAHRAGVLSVYRLLLGLASTLVLLFQAYWWYYTHFEGHMARKYHSEITDLITGAKAGTDLKDISILSSGTCIVDYTKTPPTEDEKDWRTRKRIEVDYGWNALFAPKYITRPIDADKTETLYPCDYPFPAWRILTSHKQLNMWTFALLAYWLIAHFAARRILTG